MQAWETNISHSLFGVHAIDLRIVNRIITFPLDSVLVRDSNDVGIMKEMKMLLYSDRA